MTPRNSFFFDSYKAELLFSIPNHEMEFINTSICCDKRVIIAGGDYDDNMAVSLKVFVYNIPSKTFELVFDETEFVNNMYFSTKFEILHFNGNKEYYYKIEEKGSKMLDFTVNEQEIEEFKSDSELIEGYFTGNLDYTPLTEATYKGENGNYLLKVKENSNTISISNFKTKKKVK